MNSPSKAIPGIAVGDTVWLADRWLVIPARVLRTYTTTGKALVRWGGARGGAGAILDFNERLDWWRIEAEAQAAMREKRRAWLVRDRETAERDLHRALEYRAAETRRLQEYEARINAEIVAIDAALAELDAEEQP